MPLNGACYRYVLLSVIIMIIAIQGLFNDYCCTTMEVELFCFVIFDGKPITAVEVFHECR